MLSYKKIAIFSICGTIVLIGVCSIGSILCQLKKFPITINTNLPSGQVFSNGFINLQFDKPNDIDIQETVRLYVDGVKTFSLSAFPSNLQIPTQGLADGNHTISIIAISTEDINGFASIIVLVQNPRLLLVSLDYPRDIYPGLVFTISIEVSGPASYFVADYSSLFGNNAVFNSTTRNGDTLSSTIDFPMSLPVEEGIYSIPLHVIGTDGSSLYVPGVEVLYQSAQTNPFTIEEGIIEFTSFPMTNATNATDASLNFALPADTEISITTGQTIEIPLVIAQNSTASAVLVGFEGFSRHFTIPISSLSTSNGISRRSTHLITNVTIIILQLTLPMGSFAGISHTFILIRLSNIKGLLGATQRIYTTLSASQAGTLHIRLSWDQDVDLDLHVEDPNGEEIYYGNTVSAGQVGFLDLDSNPDCKIDNVTKENIYYYQNATSGNYIVRVDYYKNCGITTNINFKVLVEGCNVHQEVSGSFGPSEADAGGQGSGRQVLVFNATCDTFFVDGSITGTGKASSKFNPLDSIVRIADGLGNVYGESQVQLNPISPNSGIFSISYQPTNVTAPVYLEVLSSNKRIRVTDNSGGIHVYRDDRVIIPLTEPLASRNVTINLANSSGAFYIMKTLTGMLPLYYAYGGKSAELPLAASWELGKFANSTLYQESFFEPSNGVIYISGDSANANEFEDSVLLRQFGLLIIKRTGVVININNRTQILFRFPPSFGFFEGYAIYLAQKIIGNPSYCESNSCINLSNLFSPQNPSNIVVIHGTSDSGNPSGDISKFVVASAAYQLDFSFSLGDSMKQSLTNQLQSESNYNRLGDTSAVDFADMIRIVVCNLDKNEKNMVGNRLNGEYKLPWINDSGFCA